MEWKDIRKKSVKDQLVLEFVKIKMDEYSLSLKSAVSLFELLRLLISNRDLTSSHIHYDEQNDCIKQIDSILFEQGEFNLVRSFTMKKSNTASTLFKTYNELEKYLKEITKR